VAAHNHCPASMFWEAAGRHSSSKQAAEALRAQRAHRCMLSCE
jgi:hypothetical protein